MNNAQPFSPEWHEQFKCDIEIACYWKLIDLNQTLREELKDVNMSRIRFAITPNSVWDLLEKRVAFGMSGVREEEKARYKPFATNCYKVPDGTAAEFLNKMTENSYVVIFPQEEKTIYREHDGMMLIQMARLNKSHW